ncbi:MAG: hypothetical protein E7256_11345 [Lachnospiraceae bacterium]|nr:hypothetical protein [Lachnospiraceae bacterium]
MDEILNERIVIEFFLSEIDHDSISYLKDRPYYKDKVQKRIEELLASERMNAKIQAAKGVWKALFEAAMTFIDPDKQGYDSLFAYFDEFVEFEELIFASDSYYRDHTLHCLWVYFLEEYLVRKEEFKPFFTSVSPSEILVDSFMELIHQIHLEDTFTDVVKVSTVAHAERTYGDSIRCVAALCHDLGYPLKKIEKINSCMKQMLPFFCVHSYQDFDFQFNNVQQEQINSFIDFLSSHLMATLDSDNPTMDFLETDIFEIDEQNNLIGLKEDALSKLTPERIELMRVNLKSNLIFSKMQSFILSYSSDFEEYRHGIMSAFLLARNLHAFQNLNYAAGADFEKLSPDIATFSAKQTILTSMADHTRPTYHMTRVSSNNTLLCFVDELEEFSRISRASQSREYVEEFCSTKVYPKDSWLHIDFIFSGENKALDPERAFIGRCKRFLTLFDVPKLEDVLKLKVSCIALHTDTTYTLELAKNHADIQINGISQDIPSYLKSPEFFTKEEYAVLS